MFPAGKQVKNCCPPQTKPKAMEPATKKQRFSNLSSAEIQLLIEKKDSEGNQECCGNAFGIL